MDNLILNKLHSGILLNLIWYKLLQEKVCFLVQKGLTKDIINMKFIFKLN